MSAARGIGSFAQGFAGSVEAKRESERRKAADTEATAAIERLAASNESASAGYHDSAMQARYDFGGQNGQNGHGSGVGRAPRGTMFSPEARGSGNASPRERYAGDPRGAAEGSLHKPAGGRALLFQLNDKHEGGGRYDTLFGHSQRGGQFDGVDVTKMTLGELRGFASPSGEYGQWVKGELGRSGQRPRVATPMGAHQIVGTTLRSAAKRMGLSDDTVFTPEVQDTIAMDLARRRIAGSKTMSGKRAALRAEWEGYKNVSDQDLDRAIMEMEG